MFKLLSHTEDGRVRMRVFTGPDIGSLQLAGELVLSPDEWSEVSSIFTAGAYRMSRDVVSELTFGAFRVSVGNDAQDPHPDGIRPF